MTQRHVEKVRTSDPNAFTIRKMGEVAQKSANTWTMREWAARLAAQAGPRDYPGQLQALYGGILDRWRYVMEPGEWVAGSPRALLGNVLGLSYRGAEDPTRADASRLIGSPKTMGWGDCDDVSALVAAGALALGMTPTFRVARKGGTAHVSTMVRTPAGQIVSVDPVGYPTYPFGWSMPGDRVDHFTLSGNTAQIEDQKMPCATCSLPTLLAGFDSRRGCSPGPQSRGHWAAVAHGAPGGARVIAIPKRFHDLFKRGIAVDGIDGVGDDGLDYSYDAMRDIWVQRTNQPMGAGFFKKLRKRTAGIRKLINRVAKPLRKIQAKLLKNKVVQNAVGAALMSVGIPRAGTKALLEMSGQILERGGVVGLIKMIKKDPKKAMQMIAQSAKASIKRATQVFSGIDDDQEIFEISQNGGSFAGVPVMALVGVPYIADFGELTVSSAPMPGSWYRAKAGDSLLKIAQVAYGVPTGTPRLERARWINNAKANASKVDPKLADNLFKSGKISLSPRFSSDNEAASLGKAGKSYAVIWIPTTAGDEPTTKPAGTTPVVPPVRPPVQDPKIDPTPSGGGIWYQVKGGDTLLGVAGKIYGLGSGSARLERARWMNAAKANAFAFDPKLKDSLFPAGKLSFSPRYGASRKEFPRLWAPASKGHEPSVKPNDLPPIDPTPPIDPPDDKLAKFKAACEKTPNGHFIVGKTGPACMVCHPEKGEVWDPVRQLCVQKPVKPTDPVDPDANKKAMCAAQGGSWDASRRVCKPKTSIPPVDPFKQQKIECASRGGKWDVLSRRCVMPGTELPDIDPREAACIASGGAWDPSAKVCRRVEVDPDPIDPIDPVEEKNGSMMPLLAMAALALLSGGK